MGVFEMIKKHIKFGINILSNPEQGFKEAEKRTFEETVNYYIWLLVAVSIAAGLFDFLYSLIKVEYFNLFFEVEINYWRMINYQMGRSTSIIFFYIFAGTFLLFIVSVVLMLFLLKMKYVDLLKVLLYSATPMLFFSWIPYSPIPLIIWSMFLFLNGVKAKRRHHVKKDSIKYRE